MKTPMQQKQYREENPEVVAKWKKTYYLKNKDKQRIWARESAERNQKGRFVKRALDFGATLNEAQSAFLVDRCEACQQERTMHIDHCHTTGRYRGMLCSDCNTGLGYFQDQANLLQRAISYLERTLLLPDCVEPLKGVCPVCKNLSANKYCSRTCQDRARAWRRKGLGVSQFYWLYDYQNGQCAICDKSFTEQNYQRPYIDHDHSTDKVRGLLCLKCNLGLGLLQDNRDLLQTLTKYVENHGMS